MRILRARLLAAAQEEADAAASDARRSQVRTVDRSERIRTYNYRGEPDLRPPHRLQVLQPRPGPRRRPPAGPRLLRRRWTSPHRLGRPRAVTPRGSLAGAAARLREAGVPSPEHDAAELLAHVLGTERSRLPLVDEVPAEAARAVRRPGGPPGGPRAAPAPDRRGVVPPRPARGRPGRLHARGRRPSCWPAGRSRPAGRSSAPVVVDLCTGSGAIAKAVADEVPARPGARRRARRAGVPLGRAQPGRHRRRPAPGRLRHRLRRPGRHGRRGGLQPAVRPARGVGVGGARGARPRPAPRAVLRRRRPRRDPGAGGAGRRAAPARGSARRRARRRPGRRRCPAVFSATGRWTEVRDHRDLAGRPRFTTARLAR